MLFLMRRAHNSQCQIIQCTHRQHSTRTHCPRPRKSSLDRARTHHHHQSPNALVTLAPQESLDVTVCLQLECRLVGRQPLVVAPALLLLGAAMAALEVDRHGQDAAVQARQRQAVVGLLVGRRGQVGLEDEALVGGRWARGRWPWHGRRERRCAYLLLLEVSWSLRGILLG